MTNVDKYVSRIFKPHFNKVFTTRDDTLRFRTQYSNITNIRERIHTCIRNPGNHDVTATQHPPAGDGAALLSIR